MSNIHLSNIRLSNIIKESIVDGPGIRYTIFTQGCLLNCKNCHNKHTQDLNGGFTYDIESIVRDIKDNYSNLDGITISGGEPFLQVDSIMLLIEKIKDIKKKGILRDDFSIIVFSGYSYEKLRQRKENKDLLEKVDLLIDGPYMDDKRSLQLKFRGSSNQRVIPLSNLGEELLDEF